VDGRYQVWEVEMRNGFAFPFLVFISILPSGEKLTVRFSMEAPDGVGLGMQILGKRG